MSTIKYPKWLNENLRYEIISYLENNNYTGWKKSLVKKLIEDFRMEPVYNTLGEINHRDNPLLIAMKRHPASLIPGICVSIFEQSSQVQPLKLNEYKKHLRMVRDHLKIVNFHLKILKNSGIGKPEWLSNPIPLIIESAENESSKNIIDCLLNQPSDECSYLFDDLDFDVNEFNNYFPTLPRILDILLKQINEDSKIPPRYATGNSFMSRKVKKFHEHFFINRLSIYMNKLFQSPYHALVGIITNVAFELDDKYDSKNVLKLLK